MKNVSKWLKQSMHLSLALLVTAVLGIGLTVAFFTDTEGAINRARVGEINVTTEEDVDGLTKSNIAVTSNGTSEAYVRMRVDIPTVTYSYLDGEESIEGAQAMIRLPDLVDVMGVMTATDWDSLPVGTTIPAIITHADGSKEQNADIFWKKESDGFWYLSITLKQGESAEIIESITYPGLWDTTTNKLVDPLPDGLTEDMLTIVITSEAVQTMDGVSSAQEAFQKVDSGSTE